MGTEIMCSVKMTALNVQRWRLLALTIVLTAYHYHEYCFFTLKNGYIPIQP
jgi:hypothetical protein